MTRTQRGRGTAVEVVSEASMHSGHVGILSSTWLAAMWVRWAPFLGQISADLDLGPKSKVAAHLMIYKTY